MEQKRGYGLAVAGVAAIILIAVARHSPAPKDRPQPTPAPTVSDWQRVARAETEVRKMLRAPDSAKFEDVRVSNRGGTPIVCGYVNSQNGFGGMTGRQRFVSGSVTAIEEKMEPGGMDKAWAKVC